MKTFKEFGITPKVDYFTGKSISIDEILNLEIIVHAYKIAPSKKKQNTDYLTLQIEIDGKNRVLFTGSTVLMQIIKQVQQSDFPFTTKIVKKNEYLEFT